MHIVVWHDIIHGKHFFNVFNALKLEKKKGIKEREGEEKEV